MQESSLHVDFNLGITPGLLGLQFYNKFHSNCELNEAKVIFVHN